MQDDHHHGSPALDPEEQAEEMRRAAEREILLDKRRTRQTGTARQSKAKFMVLLLVVGATFLLLVITGPTGLFRFFGIIGNESETSQVNMEVNRERETRGRLDFVVPAIEQKEEKAVDPNDAWNVRFKQIQDKLAAMERNREPELSSGDIRKMLQEYNETMVRRLEAERKAMAEENARLRAEAERAEAERRRLEEEARLRAATAKEREKIEKLQRESSSIVVDEKSSLAGETVAGSAEGEIAADLDQNGRFLKSAASSVVQTAVSQKLLDPARMVVQGTIISAVLETAIDTQLPGNIRAQVMQPVYSFDGSRVLMPPGTVLIGQFNNSVDLAQKRVLIAWNRAVTPEGKSIAIGSTGTDTLGRAGTLGNVDNRYGTKFGAAMLISAISAIPSALSNASGSRRGGRSGSGGTTVNIGGEVANEAGSSLADQTSGVLEKYLSLPPVIRIPQGEEIRVFVNRDLVFK